jgi:hypothetical protein
VLFRGVDSTVDLLVVLMVRVVLRGRLVTSEHDQRDGWRGSPADEAGFGSPGRLLR